MGFHIVSQVLIEIAEASLIGRIKEDGLGVALFDDVAADDAQQVRWQVAADQVLAVHAEV